MMKRLKKKSEKSGLMIVVANFGVVEGVLVAQILTTCAQHLAMHSLSQSYRRGVLITLHLHSKAAETCI